VSPVNGAVGICCSSLETSLQFCLHVDDGRQVVNFADGTISGQVDDELAWPAKFTGADASLRLRGKRIDDLEWDIPKQNPVEELAREVKVSLGNQFGVTVSPVLSDLKGTLLKRAAASKEDWRRSGRFWRG
jgi:hypothetical protein